MGRHNRELSAGVLGRYTRVLLSRGRYYSASTVWEVRVMLQFSFAISERNKNMAREMNLHL